jgi:threonine dehydrogenase-like Zn-dependent dehydrogenase
MPIQKVVRIQEINKIEIVKRELPEKPKPGTFRVRQIASLISPGTELAIYTGTHAAYKDKTLGWGRAPMDTGYMFVGEVIDAGDCGNKYPLGMVMLLPLAHANLHDVDTNDSWIAPQILPLPDRKHLEEATFIPFATITATAPFIAPPKKDSKVAIVGMGPIGQLALQHYTNALVASTKPERAVGFDVSAKRVAVAKKCGFEAVAVPKDQKWADTFKQVFAGGGPDIIVEATGNAHVAAALMEGAPLFSTVVLLGSTRFPVEIDLYKWIHSKGLRILGAHARLLDVDAGAKKKIVSHFYDDIAAGRLVVAPLITDHVTLDRAEDGYKLLVSNPEDHMGVILKA